VSLQYVKLTPIQLKGHPEFAEKWVQDRIRDEPSILGLGDLEVKDVERMQPQAGRLDLLLRDPDSGKRYELELMLGTVDPSHIIRTIEYWDIERKRYPQYDHCAVIVAENITSRFLNVIGLFNSAIPIIALQLNAYQIGESVSLTFTRVLDEVILGEDDDDIGPDLGTTRDDWEGRVSPSILGIVDQCFAILRKISPQCDLRYNKYYIGLAEDGRTNNFVCFRPKRRFVKIEARVSDLLAWKARIEEAGMTLLGGPSNKRLLFRITSDELKANEGLVEELFKTCYQEQAE
jgi:hypothetical protein